MTIRQPAPVPCWETAATNHNAKTSPAELSKLGKQLSKGHEVRGALFTLRCYADAVVKFATSHLVTTAMFIALVVALGILAS